MRTSVIVTVRNEARSIGNLLESLVGQGAYEVIVVDAQSTDGTVAVARRWESRLPLQIDVRPCTRGAGRNRGARLATGDLLAFIDGDCVARPGWVAALQRASMRKGPKTVVAGHTQYVGRAAFAGLERVELVRRGHDTTWPSCNLAYPKALFEELGGFDPVFVTAEDIDLNVRAVDAGASIVEAPEAVVEALVRPTIAAFLRQAYWNGYGRKQLTRKHGRLWRAYSFSRMLRLQGRSVWGILRLAAGATGYLVAKARRPPKASSAEPGSRRT